MTATQSEQRRESARQLVLQALNTAIIQTGQFSARLVTVGLIAATIATITGGGEMPAIIAASPILAELVRTLGGNVLAGVLERAAEDESLTADDIRALLEEKLADDSLHPLLARALDDAGLNQLLTQYDFYQQMARIGRRDEHILRMQEVILASVQTLAARLTAPTPDLQEALARLAALPTDERAPIPTVAPLPSQSRLPFRPNPHFVGREAEARTLARAMQAGQTAAIGQTMAVSGLGGIGKTQLAVEFAHRYGGYFAGGVLWINATDPQGIAAEIVACGGAAHPRTQIVRRNLERLLREMT